jgi:AcrR family transcriptional regulator
MRAALRCVERDGVSGFSMADVAEEAGFSRNTIYRHFPDGRAQLVAETATWEVARFWGRMAESVSDLDLLEDRLVVGLATGSGLLHRSEIMTNLMDPDLEELAGALEPARPLVMGLVRDYVRELLETESESGRLRAGIDVDQAADYLTRMVLSTLTSPAGTDLTDPEQTRRLVRREFLGGIAVQD